MKNYIEFISKGDSLESVLAISAIIIACFLSIVALLLYFGGWGLVLLLTLMIVPSIVQFRKSKNE